MLSFGKKIWRPPRNRYKTIWLETCKTFTLIHFKSVKFSIGPRVHLRNPSEKKAKTKNTKKKTPKGEFKIVIIISDAILTMGTRPSKFQIFFNKNPFDVTL